MPKKRADPTVPGKAGGKRKPPQGASRPFAAEVISWQKKHGRHGLPWQNTRDAYRIWLSEIMLQQTQVATVIPYYGRFLQRFPDIASLAAASLDDVLKLWSGLGYYSRARNLHSAAKKIMAGHGGVFPQGLDAVMALPGIGRSTAAAICAFAYGARGAILDGNVKRLLARRFGIAGYAGERAVAESLWRVAESELPANNIEAYTQGLMDLGAAVCTRARPGCLICPVAAQCIARIAGRIGEIPAPRPRKTLPQRRIRMLVLLHAGTVMLEKRAASGIWGGMWSLPEVAPQCEDDIDIAALCAQRYAAVVRTQQALPPLAHGFTHFKLDIEPQCLRIARMLPRAASADIVWLPLQEALAAAIPAPVRRILAAL